MKGHVRCFSEAETASRPLRLAGFRSRSSRDRGLGIEELLPTLLLPSAVPVGPLAEVLQLVGIPAGVPVGLCVCSHMLALGDPSPSGVALVGLPALQEPLRKVQHLHGLEALESVGAPVVVAPLPAGRLEQRVRHEGLQVQQAAGEAVVAHQLVARVVEIHLGPI